MSSSLLIAAEYPHRGLTKDEVRSEFGQPGNTEGPVGSPPITRWEYDNFTVVFEYNHVLHSYPRQYELEERTTSTISPRPSSGDQLNFPE